MSRVAELVAQLGELDAERLAIKARAREIKAELDVALAEEHAEGWGLTAEEYAEAREPITQRESIQSEANATNVQIAKLTRYLSDPKRSEDREDNTAAVKSLRERLEKLNRDFAVCSREPLAVLLNRARTAKGLPPRNVQGATALPL